MCKTSMCCVDIGHLQPNYCIPSGHVNSKKWTTYKVCQYIVWFYRTGSSKYISMSVVSEKKLNYIHRNI